MQCFCTRLWLLALVYAISLESIERGTKPVRATPFTRIGTAVACYFVAAAACIALTRFGAQVAPIWLASPILVFALISTPGRSWPALLSLGAAAHILANMVNHEPATFATPYLVANIAEAFTAAALLRRAKVELTFADRAEVFRFLAICGLAAPIASAVLVKIGLTLTGETISDGNLMTWYLAIALGLVLFLPLLKAINTRAWGRLLRRQPLRAAILFGLLIAACATAMIGPSGIPPLVLIFPILILIAFDFGLAGAEAGLSLAALLLITGVVLGYRPDFGAEGPREDIVRLQLLLAILSAGILPLAATVEEKQRLYESASHAHEEAQQAWGDVIAAEANYRLLADSTRAFVLRINAHGAIASASASSPFLGFDLHGLEGTSLSDYLDEASATALRDALVAPDPVEEDGANILRLRVRGRDDSWRFLEAVIRRPPSPSAHPREFILILTPVD